MTRSNPTLIAIALMFACVTPTVYASRTNQPNVIMFVLDDLNDWVAPLGYTQVKTPNLDRLARSGVTFRNAHAPGVFCAPSRTAIMTGMHASTTGCYENEVFHYDHPDLKTLQMAFKQAGYSTYGAGKIYHHRSGYVDLRGWDTIEGRWYGIRVLCGCTVSRSGGSGPIANIPHRFRA